MKTNVEIEVRNYREQEIEYRDKQGEIAKFVKKTVTGLDADGAIVVASLGRNSKLPPLSPGDLVALSWSRAEQKDGLWMLSGCVGADGGTP